MTTSSRISTTIDGLQEKPEAEERFLLLTYDEDILKDRRYDVIEQAYFSPEIDSRIRIINGIKAEYTRKAGVGEVRGELDCPTPDVRGARFLLESTPYRFTKHRHDVDHWDFDAFQGAAAGIPIIEFEAKEGRKFDGRKPGWVGEWIKVTRTLTSKDIAFLMPALQVRDPSVPILQYVMPMLVRRFAIEGGPGSGKDGVIRHLKERLGEHVAFVDETATTIDNATGVKPAIADPVHNMRFQRDLYQIQSRFESIACAGAARAGKKAVAFNRGTVGNADYLPGGPGNFHLLAGRPFRDEYIRYDLVLYLTTPPATVYDEAKGNNGTRSEDHPQALARGERNRDLYKDHPGFVEFGNYADFGDKCAAVEAVIREHLDL